MSTAVRVALETVHGVQADTPTWVDLPVNFSAKLAQENWTPEEQRNAQDIHFAVAPAIHHEEWEIADSAVYTDSMGPILSAALGPLGGGAYKLANDPSSLTMIWSQRLEPVQSYKSLYGVVDRFGIRFDAEGELTFSAAGIAMPEAEVADVTPTFSTQRPMAAWRGVVTKGADTAYALLTAGAINVMRNRRPKHTIRNAQAPYKMTIGSRSVDFNLDLLFETTDDYDAWRAADTEVLEIEWTDGADTFGVLIPKAAYRTAEIDDGSDTPVLRVTGRGLYDATDSKIKVTIA